MSQRKLYFYPLTYQIDDDINIHIEHIDGIISCIWFDNNNQEEINIPNEFKVYSSNDKMVNPFRNTQSFAISRDVSYNIMYRNKTIIKLRTELLLCYPAERTNQITVVTSDDEDSEDSDYSR